MAQYEKAYYDKLKDQMEVLDNTNWLMGQYVGHAIVNVNRKKGTPSSYPKEPYTVTENRRAKNSKLTKTYTKAETEEWLDKDKEREKAV